MNLKNIIKPNWISIAIIVGIVGLLILLFIIIWVIFDPEIYQTFHRLDLDKASKLGGFIAGIVGVFWSFAGIILIYATFQEQKKLYIKQKFESSFFNMLNIYHDIVNNTKVGEMDGRRFFSYILGKLKDGIVDQNTLSKLIEGDVNNLISDDPKNSRIKIIDSLKDHHFKQGVNEKSIFEIEEMDKINSSRSQKNELRKDQVNIIYEGIYKDYQSELGYYFRYIFNIFNFVIKERKKYDDDKFYINLIQAQMSNDELGLLFYNALSKNARTSKGEYRFFNWLDEYDFFQNIDEKSLFHPSHCEYYPKNKIKFCQKN